MRGRRAGRGPAPFGKLRAGSTQDKGGDAGMAEGMTDGVVSRLAGWLGEG